MRTLSLNASFHSSGISDHKKVKGAMEVEADTVDRGTTRVALEDVTTVSMGELTRMALEDPVAARLAWTINN